MKIGNPISAGLLLRLLILLLPAAGASGFGSMGPISAAFGDLGFFCAIDASGKQEVICWGNTTPAAPIPAMAALSGGENFLCGISSNTSQAFCWTPLGGSVPNLVPRNFGTNAYSHIAAGKSHVCAVRGSYYSDNDLGTVDCWDIVQSPNRGLASAVGGFLGDQQISNLVFRKVVAGEGFSCGRIREGGIVCWGPNSSNLGVPRVSEDFTIFASGRSSLCGVSASSGEVKCFGDTDWSVDPPTGTRLVSLTAGAHHFCGIREDNHGIECWGSFNSSLVPRNSGFTAIASSDFSTCGIREDDLVLDCWFATVSSSKTDFDPPMELCSPGLCTPGVCGKGKFAFNASRLNEPDLSSLCLRRELNICSPCASNCSEGFFESSPCSQNADRVCTPCSFCQNSSCLATCGHQPSSTEQAKKKKHQQKSHFPRLALIIGPSVLVLFLVWIAYGVLSRLIKRRKNGTKTHFASCIGKPEPETESIIDSHTLSSAISCPGTAQVFRLSELRDATNGFKEFNEVGRGSYGFVYKAVLADGQQVAVKRANAATIIRTNNRDFEVELDVLCRVRHCNIVNLLGYCTEMGERLLVYEFMAHGTLYDHLHGGLSPLNWCLRLKIAMQAAKGLEYLHNEATPSIAHRDVKTSNILLDSDWVARVGDFCPHTTSETNMGLEKKADVYSFGVVLLEILSGRKDHDRDFSPSTLVGWAVPLIRQGKAATLIDRFVALPRNVEPLLKLADVAELAVKEDLSERPTISAVAGWLEQIVKDGLIL